MPSAIQQSVGRGGVNRSPDVRTIQELLNQHIGKLTPLRPLVVDGAIGQNTIRMIEEFQRRVVGLSLPDGRVDPGGKTLAALNQSGGWPAPAPPPSLVGTVRLVFQHGGKIPTVTTGLTATANSMYESSVSVLGKSFRGSIYPDDMNVKGRIKDGTYDLYIGFHKRTGQPTAADLVVREQNFRAALVVNCDNAVPVTSNSAAKTTSSAIHVHNGFNSKRYSEGCPTIQPSDWSAFIKLFLDAFPSLSDWTSTNTYVGKKIGVLEVKA